MMKEEGGSDYDIRSIILEAIGESITTKFLELCYVIYETKNKASHTKKILIILNNQELMRQIRQLEALTEENEHKIFYYGEDEYNPKTLTYKKELEKTIRDIRNEQLKNLAQTLKEINEEEEIDI